MPKIRKYTDADVIEAVRTSTSIRQVLSKLNLRQAGGNYDSCKKNIARLDLDTSHFTRTWNKGRKTGPKRPIVDYLKRGSSIQSFKLKNRLLKEDILEYRCSNCKLTSWLDEAIPLELDHIDGDRYNNLLENLRLLCPNCHALTPTYRGRNINR